MQRWALTLLAYEYELVYRPSSQNGNADALSRLPSPDVTETTPIPGDIVHLLDTINTCPEKIITLSAYTITGRPSSLHCGPEINIQIEHNICHDTMCLV